jgi:filamentous hemagglutinin
LQTGGNTLKPATARVLNEAFDESRHSRDWGRALEDLKSTLDLRNDFHGKIMSNGGYLDKEGKLLGNLADHLP